MKTFTDVSDIRKSLRLRKRIDNRSNISITVYDPIAVVTEVGNDPHSFPRDMEYSSVIEKTKIVNYSNRDLYVLKRKEIVEVIPARTIPQTSGTYSRTTMRPIEDVVEIEKYYYYNRGTCKERYRHILSSIGDIGKLGDEYRNNNELVNLHFLAHSSLSFNKEKEEQLARREREAKNSLYPHLSPGRFDDDIIFPFRNLSTPTPSHIKKSVILDIIQGKNKIHEENFYIKIVVRIKFDDIEKAGDVIYSPFLDSIISLKKNILLNDYQRQLGFNNIKENDMEKSTGVNYFIVDNSDTIGKRYISNEYGVFEVPINISINEDLEDGLYETRNYHLNTDTNKIIENEQVNYYTPSEMDDLPFVFTDKVDAKNSSTQTKKRELEMKEHEKRMSELKIKFEESKQETEMMKHDLDREAEKIKHDLECKRLADKLEAEKTKAKISKAALVGGFVATAFKVHPLIGIGVGGAALIAYLCDD